MTDKRRDGPPRGRGGGKRNPGTAGASRDGSDKSVRGRDETKARPRPEQRKDAAPKRFDRDRPPEQRRDGAPKRLDRDRPPERATVRRPAPGKPKRPRAPQQPGAVDRSEDEARIAKVIARAGLCSRRDAEAWIAAGRVAVNGKVLDSPALNVTPQDEITVDGHPLAAREPTRLFLFHKPRGSVTTDRDPEGRPTIFSQLPEGLPRLVTIGRLDINTEGLLLLTNDGGLARVLELPATGWLRRYRVRAHGETDQAVLDALRDGVSLDGVDYAGIEATLDRSQGANVWLTMGLREGKNREIKRVLESLGLAVNRLIRISFGPFQLGKLAEGAVEEVKARVIQDQLGDDLARQAGVDFEGGVIAPIVTQEVRRQQRAERHDAGGSRGTRERGSAPRGQTGYRGSGHTVEPEARPRRERPNSGPRKHVSVLRAQQEASRAEGRQRIERAETADRKGRAVMVERVVKAHTDPTKESARPRNARRFALERSEAAEQRHGPPRKGGGAVRPHPGGGARTLKRKSPERPSGDPRRGRGKPEGGLPPRGKR